MNTQNRVRTDSIDLWYKITDYLDEHCFSKYENEHFYNDPSKKTTDAKASVVVHSKCNRKDEFNIGKRRTIRFKPGIGIIIEYMCDQDDLPYIDKKHYLWRCTNVIWYLDQFNEMIDIYEQQFGGFKDIRLPDDF